MTHQPTVPEAAQSPYPLQSPPHNDNVAKLVVATRNKEAEDGGVPLAQLIGIGVTLLGAAAVAAWYYRRGAPKPAKRQSPKRQSANRQSSNRQSSNRKSSDPRLVAAGQPYEVTYFARKHGITAKEARAIIAEAGPSRTKANALAAERKG